MSKHNFMNVKVDADLVRKAKVVATLKNVTLSRYITELVRPQVESDLVCVTLGLTDPAGTDRSLCTGNGRAQVG
jgi:hypothetical protein